MSTAIEATGLTETQRQIVDLAREFARTKIEPHAAEWDRTAHFPRDVIDELGKLGFLGMGTPEAYDGMGLDAARRESPRSLCRPMPRVIVRGSRRISWACGPPTRPRSGSRTSGSRRSSCWVRRGRGSSTRWRGWT